MDPAEQMIGEHRDEDVAINAGLLLVKIGPQTKRSFQHLEASLRSLSDTHSGLRPKLSGIIPESVSEWFRNTQNPTNHSLDGR